LGQIPNPQSPIPNPQSPYSLYYLLIKKVKNNYFKKLNFYNHIKIMILKKMI